MITITKIFLITIIFSTYIVEAKNITNNIAIDYLKNHPEHIKTCATWAFETWGHYKPNETLQDFIESQKPYLNINQIPFTFLAFDEKIPVGMCSIAKNRGILPELSPWLASLYVRPDYRNRGIGSLLENNICKKAHELGYKKIYLFTSNKINISWYERLRWKQLQKSWINNHEVSVMEKDLIY